jgi:hypothetical protein
MFEYANFFQFLILTVHVLNIWELVQAAAKLQKNR